MFLPKLGSHAGTGLSHERIFGLLVGVAAGDRRVMPFSTFTAPEKMEMMTPLWEEPRPLIPASRENSISKARRNIRRMHEEDKEDIDEADEGVPKQFHEIDLFARPDEDSPFRMVDTAGVCGAKTALTMAVMNSIVQQQGIDLYSILEEHVEALTNALEDGSILAWPGTIRYSIQSIALTNSVSESYLREREFLETHKVRPPAVASITYFTSGNNASLEDGYLTKLAPMAAYYATRDLEEYSRWRKLWELERVISITHTHPLAYVCGIVYATFLERLMRMESTEKLHEPSFRQLLLMELYTLALEMEGDYRESGAHVSKALNWFISNCTNLDHSRLFRKCSHSSRQCVNSLIWILGLFYFYSASPIIIRLSSLVSRPTDAKLSMAISLAGVFAGRHVIPPPFVRQIPKMHQLLECSRQFATVLTLPTSTKPTDVVPAESLDFIEEDDHLSWALPYRPNGPLIAEALYFQPVLTSAASFFSRFWRITRIGDFLEWLSQPTPLKVSTLFFSINYLVAAGAFTLIMHGKAITAPQPPAHEHDLHQRHYPVLMPNSGGELRTFKESHQQKEA